MLKTSVITTQEQMESLALHWNSLDAYIDTPIAKYDWSISCMEKVLRDNSIFVVVAESDDIPVAIAPLVKPKSFFKALEQNGIMENSEPTDFSYKDDVSLDYLTDSLAKNKMPLFLTSVMEESPLVLSMKKAYRRRGLFVCRSHVGSPYIEIDTDESKTQSELPKRLQSDLRRARRKAESLGEVKFDIHSPSTLDELAPLLDESLRIEAEGWKGKSGTALKEDQELGDFYRAYLLRACKQGILRICFLSVNGQNIAMQIALESGGRFWLLKIGYDERFSNCSPGMLLIYETLQYAAINKLKSYEFLGTAADWTRRWTKDERKNCAIRTFPFTLRGMAILVVDLVRYSIFRLRGAES